MNPDLLLVAPNEVVAEVAHIVAREGEFNCSTLWRRLKRPDRKRHIGPVAGTGITTRHEQTKEHAPWYAMP